MAQLEQVRRFQLLCIPSLQILHDIQECKALTHRPWCLPFHLQGLVSVTFSLLVLSARLMVSVFITQPQHAQRTPATSSQPEQRPRLVRALSPSVCTFLQKLNHCLDGSQVLSQGGTL